MTTMEQERRLELANQLYQRYGKPLEANHWGEYVVISEGGKVLLGTDDLELMEQAREAFGPGNSYMFKVGEQVVGRWR